MLPRPLPDPPPQLRLALRRRPGPQLRQVGAVCGSCGARTGWIRDASIRARSDHSKSTASDRDCTASARPRTASRTPWPTTLVCRSSDPNELCQACRSSSPARTCASAAARRPAPRASSARTSRLSSRTASGSAGPRPEPRPAGAGLVELPAASEPGRVAARPVVAVQSQPLPRAACRPARRAAHQRRRPAPTARHVGRQLIGVRPRPPARRAAPPEPARPPAAPRRAAARVVAAQSRARASSASPCRWCSPAAVGRGRGCSAATPSSTSPAAISASARSWSTIAVVTGLTDAGSYAPRHVAQRAREVSRQQRRVAEVVQRLGLADRRPPRRTSAAAAAEVAAAAGGRALEVDVAAVEVRPGQRLRRLAEQLDRRARARPRRRTVARAACAAAPAGRAATPRVVRLEAVAASALPAQGQGLARRLPARPEVGQTRLDPAPAGRVALSLRAALDAAPAERAAPGRHRSRDSARVQLLGGQHPASCGRDRAGRLHRAHARVTAAAGESSPPELVRSSPRRSGRRPPAPRTTSRSRPRSRRW